MADNPVMRAEEFLFFGPFRLSSVGRILYRDDEPVVLGSRALDILIALVERAGETVSRRDLINQVWPDLLVEDANLRVHVTHLRRALFDGRDGARYVTNVPGRGYCFVAPVTRTATPHPHAAGALSQSPAPPCNLPPRLERMVGRDETVLELTTMLLQRRFVSVVGAGGMGKTTVAIAVCRALLESFGGAVHFVDLSAISDGSFVETAVESVLGLSAGPQDCFERLVSVGVGRRTMLVLDNCEHVIDTVAPLAERLFSRAPDMFILTTSRETLRVEGEHVYLLRPLDPPPLNAELTAGSTVGWPAVQLFMERAVAGGYRFQLSDDDASLVATICRQLDGVPLAIELAAGRVGAYGIQGTANLLGNRFKLIWKGRRSALPRHRTMRAMLDWSYNLLSNKEQRVFCRLSIFAGLFTPDAAHRVVADEEVTEQDAAEALAGLVDKSLVWVSATEGDIYYRLLNTTRSYAMLKLEECQERDIVACRHALYYSNMLRSKAIRNFEVQEPRSCEPHVSNIRAALEWCFSSRGDAAIGGELTVHAAPLFLRMALLGDCRP
jgi:predicted ATPase/DNA-binding winged helix-turn-helix (wHTH) protein